MRGHLDAPDGSIRIAASRSFNYAFLLTLVLGGGSGVWFFATQAATNVGVADRLARFETNMATRLDAADRRDEQRSESVAAIDIRLTKIEAQLSFLTQNMPRGPRQ